MERIDQRKLRNRISNIRKAENRINKKIWQRMKTLSKDQKTMNNIDEELKELKTQEDYQDYIKNANNLAAKENDEFLKKYGHTE